MKAIILRCGICDFWHGAKANHCRACGSTHKIGGKHYNYEKLMQGKLVQVVRSVPAFYALKNNLVTSEMVGE